MNVLSLFDGISCGYVALKRNQIPVKKYQACEIDKYAIKVSQTNHPDIEHLGDVCKIGIVPNLDLLIGGSPCQDLSIAKKDRKGLDGERSGLFWQYVRILKESKPKYFILENVASMPKEAKQIITEALGVEPIMINASLVSAQSRKRLFWTNIPVQGLPKDKNIFIKDILEIPIQSEYSKNKPIKLGHIGNGGSNNQGGQAHRVYSPDGKTVTLGSSGAGLIKIGRDIGRRLKDGVRADNDKTIPIERRIELRTDDKCGTLTSVTKDNLVVGEEIRKLTPIECERLQGLPDNYTEGVSITQRYKCLGNAFNVDVICFILSFI
jgi:DNA-cytosine methyltransferase